MGGGRALLCIVLLGLMPMGAEEGLLSSVLAPKIPWALASNWWNRKEECSWEVFMERSWKWCHYIWWPHLSICKGGWEMWFICVSREEDMDLENRETLSATKTHIFT